MITICPQGGLCNYLRVVFSYYEYARQNNIELNVIWISTPECPGFFLDYFEPVPHINFINFKLEDQIPNINCHYIGFSIKGGYPPKYENLKLKTSLKKCILTKVDILNKNYISVHIRRTDHIMGAKKNNCYTDDEEFIKFLNSSNKNIYIATDNEITYNKFKSLYNGRIKFNYHKTNNNKVRHTSLHDAIIDMYMCVYSDNHKGSGYSSFSDLISTLRKNMGK